MWVKKKIHIVGLSEIEKEKSITFKKIKLIKNRKKKTVQKKLILHFWEQMLHIDSNHELGKLLHAKRWVLWIMYYLKKEKKRVLDGFLSNMYATNVHLVLGGRQNHEQNWLPCLVNQMKYVTSHTSHLSTFFLYWLPTFGVIFPQKHTWKYVKLVVIVWHVNCTFRLIRFICI